MNAKKWHKMVQSVGEILVDIGHFVSLFMIGVVVIWAASAEFIVIVQNGKADLKDILMLFIYLELLAMIGIYFKTHRLPVQFLIYIAITALSRHLVVDVQAVSDTFHLWLLLTITVSIFVLSLAIVLLTWSAKQAEHLENNSHREPPNKRQKKVKNTANKDNVDKVSINKVSTNEVVTNEVSTNDENNTA